MDFLKKYRSEVDVALQDFFVSNNSVEKYLHRAMKHGVLLGGKRIRPILGLLAFEISRNAKTKVSRRKALGNLISLELIHASSLIHDDLPALDADELRRGKLTVWKKFGEANAILAGDALEVLAFENLAKSSPRDLLPELITALAQASVGMLDGQVRDLDERKARSLKHLLTTHSQKTGQLILAAVRMGAILAQAKPNTKKLLEDFAERLGLAFQIKDDLLDALGDERTLGKKVGKDVAKKGLVRILGIEKSQAWLETLTQESVLIARKLKSKKLEVLAEFVAVRVV